MPNHVTNKIEFDKQHAEKVFSFFSDGTFDFELLVPMPLNVYRGDVSMEDEKDFPLWWRVWSTENWGTKWNCYNCKHGDNFIVFDTAWSVPYPIIAAFCNKFQIPFTHKYYDEGECFWGIEVWGEKRYSPGRIQRVSKNANDKSILDDLYKDIFGKERDSEDDN